MIRRALLALIALAWLPMAATSAAQSRDVQPGDMAMGRADAPVTVVEYASVTCGHCAAWQHDVWPEFKRRFVDTGRVRFVFRELPTPPVELASAGFILARCAGPDHYFDVVHDLMHEQRAVFQAPLAQLLAIGARHGVTEAEFRACLSDPAQSNALNARVEAASARGVTGTPTFFVNGRQVAVGEAPIETLEAAIRRAEG
ncbi:DsbA family protein [Brevundimonas aveniformis]|uniref:DsbA family protein n=1 Tax=Brevundimonas aveniformis TaxID=370977 RepID=UPI000423025D|nr:DsbA family protein [Brevundimonas aveniformis]